MTATIPPESLIEAARQPEAMLIDVRTPAEFREMHVEGARNTPLDRLDPAAFSGHEGPIYVLCRSGGRAKRAYDQLVAAGVGSASVVVGGTLACDEAGLPIVRGKKAISLERQVRIAAGSLVVVGVALGLVLHPGWLGLAGFVGAGLVFAGVTDTCGMGMLIARMPWNQTADAAPPAACQLPQPPSG